MSGSVCKRLLALLAGLLTSCGLLGGPTTEFSLSEEFEEARTGPVISSHEGLPDYETTPFLGPGWNFRAGQPLKSRGNSEFLFYLLHPEPIQIVIEGRGNGVAELILNDEPFESLTLKDEWETYTIPLDKPQSGENRLVFRGAVDSEWRSLTVNSLSATAGSSRPTRRDDTLFIPFGRSLDYYFESKEGSRLQIESVAPWAKKETPESANWELMVKEGETTHQLANPSSVDLKLKSMGPTVLTLEFRNNDPGTEQAGVRITGARIVSPGKKPSPTPSPIDEASQKSEKPNVLIILVDTLRADRLGCYGYERATSPEIDSFSEEATVYENAVAQAPWTMPSVASLFTGKLPREHGVVAFNSVLPEEETTLAEILSSQGYRTACFAANALIRPEAGFGQGFRDFWVRLEERPESLTEKAGEWLDVTDRQPFFLYLHYLQPHTPHEPEPQFKERLASDAAVLDAGEICEAAWARFWNSGAPTPDRAQLKARDQLYDAEVASVSHSIGELISSLKLQDRYRDTLIILLSDHGEELMDHGALGHINSLYQELIHIPLIIKYPGGARAGTRVTTPVTQVDILPTVQDALGLDAEQVSGISLNRDHLPADRPLHFSSQAGWEDSRYRQWYYKGRGVRVGPWVLLKTEAQALNRSRPFELYNLNDDPTQKTNLYFEETRKAVSLGRLLNSQKSSSNVPAVRSNNPDAEVLRGLQYIE